MVDKFIVSDGAAHKVEDAREEATQHRLRCPRCGEPVVAAMSNCPSCDLALGAKYDQGKQPWDLLPVEQVAQVVEVLGYGARKYAPSQWQSVPDGRNRYYAAALRHLVAWWMGERTDEESGLPHLAHAVCCLLFLMWFDREDQ